jgi:hypothetical protein
VFCSQAMRNPTALGAAFTSHLDCNEQLALFFKLREIRPAQTQTVKDLLNLRQKGVTDLEYLAQQTRESILAASDDGPSVTGLRSEWKHQTTTSDNAEVIAELQKKYPPGRDAAGRKIGLSYRDKPLEGGKRGYTDTGSSGKFRYRANVETAAIEEALDAAQGRRYLNRLRDLDIYEAILLKPENFVAQLKAKNAQITNQEINAELATFYLDLRELIKKRLAKNGADEKSRSRIVAEIESRMWEEGKIRFRKYRQALEGANFTGIASPGSRGSSAGTTEIADAEFAFGVTWVEFKMKNTRGLDVRGTVVNKPRIPVSDSWVVKFHDAACFKLSTCFGPLKTQLLRDVKRNFMKAELLAYDPRSAAGLEALAKHLKNRGIEIDLAALHFDTGDARAFEKMLDFLEGKGFQPQDFNTREAEAMVDVFRDLHGQGFDTQPIQRTLYTRDSFQLDIPQEAKKPMAVQLTFDRDVRELDLATGKTVGAFPFIDKTRGWSFQFDPTSGLYNHIVNGQVQHVYDHATRQVFIFDGVTRGAEVRGLKVEAVQVAEVKVPEKVVALSPEDIQQTPALADIKEARETLVAKTQKVNALRTREGLGQFSVDAGKGATTRSGAIWKPIAVITPEGRFEFIYDYRLDAYVKWSREGNLAYLFDHEKRRLFTVDHNGRLNPVASKP